MFSLHVMKERCKVNGKVFAALLALPLVLLTLKISAKNKHNYYFVKSLTETADTTAPSYDTTIKKTTADTTDLKKDSTLNSDSTAINDSILKPKIDTLIISKDSLTVPMDYSAEDSGVLLIPDKQFFLYGKANTKNTEMDLTAATIEYSQQKNLIKAYGGIDTAKNPLSKPTIVQNGSTTISDTIVFNPKTQRGILKNTYYNEGELFVNAQKIKKIDKDVAYAYKGRFTTCDLDTPHFAIRARKMKLINNKIAVSGPAFPEFEGVPLPIGIPFGIYPLSRGRHSGLLPPQFTSSRDFGLGLEGLGYYKVINDYWDVTTRSDIYSYGGWKLDINPRYFKRYKYNGVFDLSIQRTRLLNSSIASKDEFTTSQNFFITWSHSQDTKARPGTSFSASVRAGSTKYNRYVTNNAVRNFENQLSSSITYSKTWEQGKYNLTVSANHDQNNNTRLVNLRIPTVNFTANTIYPFQKKEQVGEPKWYEKLGASYTGTLLNQFSFYDSAFSLRRLADTLQWGAQHNLPISLSLPALGPFIISPSVSYSQRWYGQKVMRHWDGDTIVTNIQRGFFTGHEVTFGVSANTRIFGTVNFPKSNGIMAIRHEVKPFISLNYKPDLAKQFYYNLQYDSNAAHIRRVSQFEGSLVPAYGEGRFGGMSFGIDNLLEMKVKNKQDTSADAEPKKVRLIDGLSITSGYNFLQDTMQWQPLDINFRSTLFEKVNITGSANIDPYDVDATGNRVNKLLWRKGSIGRFTSGNLAISTSLRSKTKDGKTDKERIQADETLTPDEQQRQLDYVRENPSEFVDFDIPWTLQLSYSLNFTRSFSTNFKSFTTQINSSLNLNGDFSLTPKWKMGGSAYVDVKAGRLNVFTMFITREMHCWQMAINITPVGLYRSFSIVINPKSGILRDLKINRSRFFYGN